jgi:hypothetical protein
MRETEEDQSAGARARIERKTHERETYPERADFFLEQSIDRPSGRQTLNLSLERVPFLHQAGDLVLSSFKRVALFVQLLLVFGESGSRLVLQAKRGESRPLERSKISAAR